jgi:hypothetical protein
MVNGYWGTVKGVNWTGCDSDHASLSITKVQDEWKYISASHVYQQGVDRDKHGSVISSSDSY